jgi:hypothetical protein
MNKTSFNPKRDLPYLAAISQAIQYIWAGITLFGGWGFIPGLFLGVLVSVTMAYASSQYSDVAKDRKKFVMFGMIVLGIFSPVIIGTSMYLDLPQVINPLWRGFVGAVWGILPDMSVLLTGFVAGKGLVAKEQTVQSEAQSQPKPAKAEPKPAFSCPYPGCEVTKPTQAAINAHQAKHKPAVIGYEASFKPITSEVTK